jgi:perosamine synthetase
VLHVGAIVADEPARAPCEGALHAGNVSGRGDRVIIVLMIPLTVPALGSEEVAAVERVLRSGMLVQGREVQAFESELAQRTRRRHAVAVASGTTALELALRALGVGPGDEVLVPDLTWPSPGHAVLAVGASVGLVDVDADEWNAHAFPLGPRTRAVIAIDQFGNPARQRELASLGVPLIVDAACSLGSSYDNRPCGSYGVIATMSFHPRKVLTTGEGGVCLTDDDALADRLRMLRNHGQKAPGIFVCAAGNHRLTELAAAIGSVQLQKLDAIVSARQQLAAHVRASLPGLSFQRAPAGGRANEQTLAILVGPPGRGSHARDRAIERLRDGGVQAAALSYALHTLPQFARARAVGSLEVAQDIAERGLALPLFPGMSEAQLQQVIARVREVV